VNNCKPYIPILFVEQERVTVNTLFVATIRDIPT